MKDNGEFCKRTVSPGEGRCWQHARNCSHRIKSLTRSQTVVFIIAIASLLTGLASLVVGIPSLYYSYVGSRNVKSSVAKPAEERTIKVVVPVLVNNVQFWLVRRDVKQYLPSDIFTVMRFTNLTSEEIQVDSLNVEIIAGFGEAPYRIYPLPTPDESWKMCCGLLKTMVVPCTLDKGFLLDVLRQPIPAGRTVYAVGLFQLPQGKLLHVSGLNLHIIDMRGKRYDIGAIIPTNLDSGSLEQSTIRNGHPAIDISAYSEQRPLYAE
jgi:hypothetical protein